jgi:small subunit ribosomal protein S11
MAKAAAAATGKKEKKAPKRKEKRVVPHGVAHIQATFNNTIVTLTDAEGGVVGVVVGGQGGLQGLPQGDARSPPRWRRRTPASPPGRRACAPSTCWSPAPGAGRESAIRSLQANGMDIKTIRDVTPIPHNGCRPRKRRRV